MRKIVIAAFLLASISSTAQAQDDDLEIATGNNLLSLCEAKDDFRQGLCKGFIKGISHMSIGFSVVCYPQGSNNRQMDDVVIMGLRNHPEERQGYPEILVMKYLKAAFPCKASK